MDGKFFFAWRYLKKYEEGSFKKIALQFTNLQTPSPIPAKIAKLLTFIFFYVIEIYELVGKT